MTLSTICRRLAALALGLLLTQASQATGTDPLVPCRLPEMNIRRDVGLGFPRIPFRLRTAGDVHVTVLFVDFADAPATRSPQEVFSLISPKAEQFYSAVSYGKMRLVFDVNPTWLRMSKASADYHFGRGAAFAIHRAYMQEAIDLAGPLDYARADAILVVTNPEVNAIDWGPAFSPLPGFGLHAGGREIVNGAASGSDLITLGWSWFTHEIGHAMSLIDTAGPFPGTGLWHTYVGEFSVMGDPTGHAKEYLGWERWQLGWLDDGQVACLPTGAGQIKLSPIERPGGTKLAIVPTGSNTAVIVESRRNEGFDHIPKPGALVYTIDTRLSSHDGAIRVQPVDNTDEHHLQAPLGPGQRLTVGNVTVAVVESDGDGDTVKVGKLP